MAVPDPIDEKRLEIGKYPRNLDSKTREYFKSRGWWAQIREEIERTRKNNFNGEILVSFELTGEKTKEKIRGYLCANLDKITREIQIKKLTFLSENKTTHFINYELLRYKPLN